MFVLRCLALLLVLPAVCSHAARPNLLLIMADDVGREAIGAYGGESYKTPRIDRLAGEGLRLDYFHASPVCHPTRTAIMSGRYLSTIGNPRWGYYAKGDFEKQTLMHELKRAGYATAMTGKYHLAMLKDDPQHPHRLGIDEYCFFGWHEGPRYWKPRLWHNGKLRDDVQDRYGPEVFTEVLIDFMKRNRKQPFIAYYSMALCHAVSDDFQPRPPHGPKGRYESYAEMIAEMDRQVGRLVDAVQELGLNEKTLVLFITDNGSPSSVFARHEGSRLVGGKKIVSQWKGEGIPGSKGKWTDWGIRVPAIARWPGTIKAGTTSDALIDVSDIMPTFCELAGVSPEFEINGRSFAGLLTGKNWSPRTWVSVQRDRGACVRNRDWKLVSDGRLFDLKKDPRERAAIKPGKDTPASAEARAALKTILDPISEGLVPKKNRKKS